MTKNGFETQGPNFVTQIHKQLGGRSSVGVFSFSFAFCVLAPQDGLEVEVEVMHFFVFFLPQNVGSVKVVTNMSEDAFE